jgi:hypothetical protein
MVEKVGAWFADKMRRKPVRRAVSPPPDEGGEI